MVLKTVKLTAQSCNLVTLNALMQILELLKKVFKDMLKHELRQGHEVNLRRVN